jgi:replicative DNA helicase
MPDDASRIPEPIHVATGLRDAWAEVELRLLQPSVSLSGIPTNYSELDLLTQGLEPGDLVVVCGPPSAGTSSFVFNIARNAAVLAKQPVTLLTLQATMSQSVQRLMCREARVDSYLLNTGRLDASGFTRIAQAMDRLCQAELWISDLARATSDDLLASIATTRAEHGAALVVVDSLDSVEVQGDDQDRLCAALKAVAKELNLAIVAASHVPRPSRNRLPTLSILPNQDIARHADVALFLDRPGLSDPLISDSEMRLTVMKNRKGPTSLIDLVFVREYGGVHEPSRLASESTT